MAWAVGGEGETVAVESFCLSVVGLAKLIGIFSHEFILYGLVSKLSSLFHLLSLFIFFSPFSSFET